MPESINPVEYPDPVVLICSPYLALTGEPSIWEAARLAGVNSVELLVDSDLICPDLQKNHSLTSNVRTTASAGQMRREAADNGVNIELFVAPLQVKAGMKSSPEWAETLLGIACSAGARHVSFPLVTDNFMAPEIPDQDYLDSAFNIFSSLIKAAGETGIHVLFENLSVYLNRPEILHRILDKFPGEDLGFCLDPVNLCWYGHPRSEVFRITEALVSRATGLHIKNIRYPPDKVESRREPGWLYDELVVPAEKGDLDFAYLVKQFKASGFTGYYGIEDDSLNLVPEPERIKILCSSVAFVKRILWEIQTS
ncbi:MAG: TIM barrel protein [Acidobacteriota bacterium]